MTHPLRYAHTVARFIDRPLLVLPRHAMAMWNVLCGRFGADPGELPLDEHSAAVDERFEASRFAGEDVPSADRRRLEPYRRMGDTAVVSVVGELVNRGAWVGANNSGLVSYEGFKQQLARVAADPKVKSVLLDIDSPGGEAVGFDVAAKAVRDLNAEKPVTAVVNGMATSAAYALASGAKHIVTTPTGISGSIGVVLLHLDHSRQLDREGVSPTMIYAGRHKVDGNPFEPLSGEVASALQAEVDAFYKSFITTVATGRAGRTSAKAARDTEAKTFIGQDAVDARLADSLGSFEEVASDMSAKSRSASRSKTMARMTRQPVAETEEQDDFAEIVEAAEPPAQHDVIEPETEEVAMFALDSARAAGADEVVQRVNAVLADERSRGRERFAVKLACASLDMPIDAVLDLVILGSGVRPIAERSATIAASAVPSTPQQQASAPAASWDKSVDAVNTRVQRFIKGER